jgi:hypothetical protein
LTGNVSSQHGRARRVAYCTLISAGTLGLVERYVGVLDDVRGDSERPDCCETSADRRLRDGADDARRAAAMIR